MASIRPLMICVIRHIPNNDPMFHHAEIFGGDGRSTKDDLMILARGWDFRIIVINFFSSVGDLLWGLVVLLLPLELVEGIVLQQLRLLWLLC